MISQDKPSVENRRHSLATFVPPTAGDQLPELVNLLIVTEIAVSENNRDADRTSTGAIDAYRIERRIEIRSSKKTPQNAIPPYSTSTISAMCSGWGWLR